MHIPLDPRGLSLSGPSNLKAGLLVGCAPSESSAAAASLEPDMLLHPGLAWHCTHTRTQNSTDPPQTKSVF